MYNETEYAKLINVKHLIIISIKIESIRKAVLSRHWTNWYLECYLDASMDFNNNRTTEYGLPLCLIIMVFSIWVWFGG